MTSSENGARQERIKKLLKSKLMVGAATVALAAVPVSAVVTDAQASQQAETAIQQRIDNIRTSASDGRLKPASPKIDPTSGAREFAWSDWKRFSDWVDWGNMWGNQ